MSRRICISLVVNKLGYESQVFLVVDTETTGLFPEKGARLIEIAAIKISDGYICDKDIFHELVNPGVIIPRNVSKIHGIRNDMIFGKPRPEGVLKRFLEVCNNVVLVMQNARFDLKILNHELWLAKLPPLRNPYVDTMDMAEYLFGRKRNGRKYSLDEILDRLHIQIGRRHRALDDAWATAEAFLKMAELIGDINSVARFIKKRKTNKLQTHR